MTLPVQTDVVIVGGGPVGLAMALEMRSRKVDFVLLKPGDGTVVDPTVDGVGARCMELFRRWGVADRVREAGWPGDHSLDCAWVIRVGGRELFRLTRHTMNTRPPFRHTPEPPAVCPRHWLVSLLRAEVGGYPAGAVWPRSELVGFEQDRDGITATVTEVTSGVDVTVRARYLVSCDGECSSVREACGIAAPARYRPQLVRNIVFRAPGLRERLGERQAMFFHLLAPAAHGARVCSVDGDVLFRLSIPTERQLARWSDPRAVVHALLAVDTPVIVLADTEWHLVQRVAESFGRGRVFLVGDSAHLLASAGGFGMDLGVCDAADLGWKLAADLDGWAGPGLLDSYTAERRPVALEAVDEAYRNMVRGSQWVLPAELDDDTPAGERARREVGELLTSTDVSREYDAPEIQLGFAYAGSPIVVPDPTVRPEHRGDRRPNTRPGSRAPHVWVRPGVSTLDLFGDGFVLLRCADHAEPGRLDRFIGAFAERDVPLSTVRCAEREVTEAYQRPFVLVRPDGHVAWRGERLPTDPGRLVDTVRGGPVT
jgi:2-polyprenyl-6-methoxyphenol hydroxylase-like FAD-dependent oxidoreductase